MMVGTRVRVLGPWSRRGMRVGKVGTVRRVIEREGLPPLYVVELDDRSDPWSFSSFHAAALEVLR